MNLKAIFTRSRELINNFFPLLFACFLLISLPLFFLRHFKENRYRQVEICLDKKAIEKLCQREVRPLEDFLLQCRNSGLVSLGLKEETLEDWINQNNLIYFSREEVVKSQSLKLHPFINWPSENILFLKDPQSKTSLGKLLSWQTGKNVSGDNFDQTNYLIFPQGFEKDELGLGISTTAVDYFAKEGFRFFFYPKTENTLIAKDTGVLSAINNSGIIVEDGEFAQLTTADLLKEKTNLLVLENTRLIPPLDKLSSRIIRAHAVGEKELLSIWKRETRKTQIQKEEIILDRLLRAVKERNIRFIYFFPLPHETLHENLQFLQHLQALLRKNNFQPAKAFSPQPFSKFLIDFRLWLAFFAAVCFPPLALFYILKFVPNNGLIKAIWLFLILSLFNLGTGIIIAGLGASSLTMLKLVNFPAIKLTLLLPILITANKFFPWDVWKKETMRFEHFFLFLIVAGLGLIYILRSGNNQLSVFPLEEKFRHLAETIFGIRPRTKEFLFGHPLMLLGLYLAGEKNTRRTGEFLILFGMIGQVSIVNSFCHLHTPVSVSLTRSLQALWSGALLGIVLIGIIKIWNLGRKNG